MKDVEIGQDMYFARVLPQIDYYRVLYLTVRTIGDDWFVGVDQETRQAYLFRNDDIGVRVFSEQSGANKVIEELEKDKN